MDYLDFDLRISSGHDSSYEAVVVRSVKGGEPRATLHVPLDEFDFMQPLYTMEAVRGLPSDTRVSDELKRHRGMLNLGETDEAVIARQIGLALFNIVFQRDIYNSYRSSLEAALEQGKGLRLRLRI
jgi:hypothetical protein